MHLQAMRWRVRPGCLDNFAQHGTARILATSKNIVCSALIVGLSGNPPAAMASPSVVAKTKQKGD